MTCIDSRVLSSRILVSCNVVIIPILQPFHRHGYTIWFRKTKKTAAEPVTTWKYLAARQMGDAENDTDEKINTNEKKNTGGEKNTGEKKHTDDKKTTGEKRRHYEKWGR
jgi:predicted FMN-binding regulatory protein PaiB